MNDLSLARPIMPIVLNLVSCMQAAHPAEDLSVLMCALEKYTEVERGNLKASSLVCPPRSTLFPCLHFVLPLLADRVERQPKAWPFLLAAASALFQFYHLPAIAKTKDTQECHASFNRADEFLRFVEPMDRMAMAVASSKDRQALRKACQQVADFTTQQLKAFTYHMSLRGVSENLFYQRTRRSGAIGWLRLAYALLTPNAGVKTVHHPLLVLRCAERSVPAFDGLRVQHAFALSLLLPQGPGQPLDKCALQSLVNKIPVGLLHAFRPASEVWRDRASFCSCCAADLRGALKARACKGCKRPAYCSEHCQRSDWAAKHRDICAVWVAVDVRSRVPTIKRNLKALEDFLGAASA
ncbi:hypothetical protein PENSPDRAFT_658925 [Peniophora sp. CONT]|nr:hypothetical protein PENSPDRAFT_658925 [Peniophora sp. CONT]